MKNDSLLNTSRFDTFLSWLCASVLVASAVVVTLKREERHRQNPVLVAPTPAQEPLGLQVARASEPGRGRRAVAPFEIPWRGWKDILLRSYQKIQDNHLLALAAGVVFYSLVALFPAIAAGVSSYGLFADAATIGKHLSIAADIVPASILDMMNAEITRIAAKGVGKLTFGFLLGFVIA